jgi:hypothetical protein
VKEEPGFESCVSDHSAFLFTALLLHFSFHEEFCFGGFCLFCLWGWDLIFFVLKKATCQAGGCPEGEEQELETALAKV